MSSKLRLFTAILFLLQCIPLSLAQEPPNCRSPPRFLRYFSPTFFCSVDVTFVREKDGSATVTERYVLPYTTGRTEHHAIDELHNQQITDVRVTRENADLEAWFEYNDYFGYALAIVTERSDTPVEYTISYRMSNAVMWFKSSCWRLSGPFSNESNVFRWSYGQWQKEADTLAVRFLNTREHAVMTLASPKRKTSSVKLLSNTKTLVVHRANVQDGTEIFVEEEGAPTGAEVFQCMPSDLWMILYVLCAVVIVWEGTKCCAGISSRSSREIFRMRMRRLAWASAQRSAQDSDVDNDAEDEEAHNDAEHPDVQAGTADADDNIGYGSVETLSHNETRGLNED